MQRADLSRLLERPWRLLAAAIAVYWLTVLVIGVQADVEVGTRELVNVVLLGPLSLLLAFRIGERIAGAALGAWNLLVWIALPWLAPLFTLSSYDATLRDRVLPMVVGLTPDGGYIEGVALLAAVALILERRRVTVAAAGLVLVALAAVWLSRVPVPDLSQDTFKANMAGLREYFWSHRVLQWIPIAGIVAVARRSMLGAVLLGGWLAAYVVVRAAQTGIGVEDGELFGALLPALPAYALLAASLPLLEYRHLPPGSGHSHVQPRSASARVAPRAEPAAAPGSHSGRRASRSPSSSAAGRRG